MHTKSKVRRPAYVDLKPRRFTQNDQWVMLYTRDCSTRVALTLGDITACAWKMRRLDDETFISEREDVDALIERIGLRVGSKIRRLVQGKVNGFK